MSITLSINDSFEVNQFSIINFILGAFLALFAFSILIVLGLSITSILLTLGFIVAAIMSFKNGRTTKVIFRINATGIFYLDNLITNWENYKCSYYKREIAGTSGLSEDTFLSIVFYKDEIDGFFIKKIKVGNEDKDENDIIDAIEFYYNASLNKTIDQSLAATTIKE